MAIVIKKRIGLEFLGEEHKEDYLVFKAVPISEYDSIFKKIESSKTNLDSIKAIAGILKEKFVEGKFSGSDVTSNDIESFDEYTLAECFSYITGQKIDPKLRGQ